MAGKSITTPVKGGWVRRDAASGDVREVRTPTGASRATPKTQQVLDDVSAKRKAALARLANR